MTSSGEVVDERNIDIIQNDVLRVIRKRLNCDNVEFHYEPGSENGESFFELIYPKETKVEQTIRISFKFLFKN